jgi:hypothetical protein
MDTYVERIDNALRVLRTIKDEDFQINAWPRCTLGNCAKDAWFNEKGFGFNTHAGTIPSFGDVAGCAAGAAFFGISHEVSERLFIAGDPILGSAYASRNPARKEAIAHLEILRMKKLAEIEVGGKIEAKDFVAAE